MADRNPEVVRTQRDAAASPGQACDPDQPGRGQPGPPREAGGTTGAGNLSPDQASRTGGATGGLAEPAPPVQEPRRGVQPDA
jgi:hypothetical protein